MERRFSVNRDNCVFNIVCLMLQESLEERVQELEKILLNERAAAQHDRATITKLQRQVNKVSLEERCSM